MLLPDLEDITDILVFEEIKEEEEETIFTEEYSIEFIETSMHLMDEYMEHNPHAISDPNFLYILLEEITEFWHIQLEEHLVEEDEMDELIEYAFNIFILTFHPDKSITYEQIEDMSEVEMDMIEIKIQRLRDIPQPIQRTPEWYLFRWNLITASNAWKAFESQNTMNQLIYEKCQPIKEEEKEEEEVEVKMVNLNTPLHWGQKYEPLSVMVYENKYNTKVEDFGCIQHEVHKFLGASPDGIVVNKESERYGRMLEIKNVVSREINGVPKKEYWVQMQLQMEVCDLDECDFLETKFTEYPDSYSYMNDLDDKPKGIIIHFHTKEGSPFYVYKPLNVIEEQEILAWEEATISSNDNHLFIKFIYWKLEVFSCVLILRKREWFKNNINQLENIWKMIEKERITGFEHRAPKKNQKKEPIKPVIETSKCLLNFNKIIKLNN
jgi:putative phage-type endonuclease